MIQTEKLVKMYNAFFRENLNPVELQKCYSDLHDLEKEMFWHFLSGWLTGGRN